MRYERAVRVERACLSSDEVVRYVDPAASTDRGALADHVDRCEACRRVVAAAVRAARVTTRPSGHGDDGAPADRVDRYTVFEPLGVGGMGVVYRAYDPRLDRAVAIKLLRPGLCDEKNRERMSREARMLARLAHPHVVAVHDTGTWQDRVYIAMELVDGVTLADWLRERPRGWREIVDVLVQAGDGLAAAHAAGLVHRDVKPHNVLVGRDARARIGDFGLAAADTIDDHAAPDAGLPAASLTAPGAVLGTPAYMSPEQLAGQPLDARTDQFSFCVTAYEALVGERPFAAASLGELRAAVREPPAVPRRARVPRRVLAPILRGLAYDPATRHPSMAPLVAALRRTRSRSHRIALGTGAIALALAAGGVALVPRGDEPTAAERCTAAARTEAFALWNPPRAAELARSLARHDTAYARDIARAAATRLAGYATSWQAGYTDACRATHVLATQTPALLDLRVACLDDKRRHADALLARLSNVDAAQLRAIPDAIAALPDVDECGNVAALAMRQPIPASGARAAEYVRLADELGAAHVDRDLGDFASGLARIERAKPAVAALGHKSLYARFASLHGELLDHLGRGEDAVPVLEEAVYLAEAARDQVVKTVALVRLFLIAGARLDKPAAERWSRLAAAALEAAPPSPYARTYLLMAQGMYAYRVDDMPAAAAKLEQALALARDDEGTTLLLGLLQNLASVYYMQERDAEAKQLWHEALAYAQRHYGTQHPQLGVVLTNLAMLEATTGDSDGALAHTRQAIAIYEASLGARHPQLGRTHQRLAELMSARPELAKSARAHFETADAILAEAYPNGHPELTDALVSHAIYEQEEGDYRTALALYEHALASDLNVRKPDDPALFEIFHGLGGAHVELDEPAKAVPLLRRALELRLRAPRRSAISLALIERDLGRALVASGERTEGRALLASSLARLRGAPNAGTYVAQVEALLARR